MVELGDVRARQYRAPAVASMSAACTWIALARSERVSSTSTSTIELMGHAIVQSVPVDVLACHRPAMLFAGALLDTNAGMVDPMLESVTRREGPEYPSPPAHSVSTVTGTRSDATGPHILTRFKRTVVTSCTAEVVESATQSKSPRHCGVIAADVTAEDALKRNTFLMMMVDGLGGGWEILERLGMLRLVV